MSLFNKQTKQIPDHLKPAGIPRSDGSALTGSRAAEFIHDLPKAGEQKVSGTSVEAPTPDTSSATGAAALQGSEIPKPE